MSEHREKDTLQRLAAFTSSLRSKPVAAARVPPPEAPEAVPQATAPADIEEVSRFSKMIHLKDWELLQIILDFNDFGAA